MTATRAALAGLLLLGAWLVASPPAGATAPPGTQLLIGLACATPLVALAMAGFRRVRQWGAWVAIGMIPYVTLSVGALLVAPGRRLEGAAFATVTVLVFFLGIVTARQRG